jgi:hypothetical protein
VSLRLTRVAVALAGLLAVAPAPLLAQGSAPELTTAIGRLGTLDYPTRMNAARTVRRATAADAVAALTTAVQGSRDEFVRFRALILLTGFNDRNTPDLMRSLLTDRNDRVREVAYRWLEQHPDPALVPTLLGMLETEQAEFVRPALVRALAAVSSDAPVQRALTTEAGRGLDFFRAGVIEALGTARARWAVNALHDLARIDGPLQDDTIVALGRIGDPASLPVVTAVPVARADVAAAVQASRCLLGDACADRLTTLTDSVTSRVATREHVRAGVAALGAVAATSDEGVTALAALLSNGTIRPDIAVGLGGVALRNPARILAWLDGQPAPAQAAVIQALREAFERLEEDYAEEQFFAAARAAYWAAADGSTTRTLMASVIEKLDF